MLMGALHVPEEFLAVIKSLHEESHGSDKVEDVMMESRNINALREEEAPTCLQNLQSGCPLKLLSARGPVSSPCRLWRSSCALVYSNCSLTKIWNKGKDVHIGAWGHM